MKRILYIDILKLFTIFLVLWGHAIMHFQPDFGKSYIFQTIYAFHMPLFMMLSGYFAVSSLELSARDFFTKKFRQLILPCISWGVICWLVITSGLIEGRFHLELKSLFTGWLGLIDNFWFLKSCFICYTLTWLSWRTGRYKIIAFVVVWVLCTMQGRFFLSTMFPSFLLGIYLRKNELMKEWLSSFWYIPFIVFLVFLSYKLYTMDEVPYALKLILGASGSLSFYAIFKSVFEHCPPTSVITFGAKLGGATLGIYILDVIIFAVIIPRYVSFDSFPMYSIIMMMPLISAALLLLFYSITSVISKSKKLAWLLLGHGLS